MCPVCAKGCFDKGANEAEIPIAFDLGLQATATFIGLGSTTWPGDPEGFAITCFDGTLKGALCRFKLGNQSWQIEELTRDIEACFTDTQKALTFVSQHIGEFDQASNAFKSAHENGLQVITVFMNIPPAFRV